MLELFIDGTHIPVQVDRWTVNKRGGGKKTSITIPFTVTATAASARALFDADAYQHRAMIRVSEGNVGTQFVGNINHCHVVGTRHDDLVIDAELLVSEWPIAVERSPDAVLIGGA